MWSSGLKQSRSRSARLAAWSADSGAACGGQIALIGSSMFSDACSGEGRGECAGPDAASTRAAVTDLGNAQEAHIGSGALESVRLLANNCLDGFGPDAGFSAPVGQGCSNQVAQPGAALREEAREELDEKELVLVAGRAGTGEGCEQGTDGGLTEPTYPPPLTWLAASSQSIRGSSSTESPARARGRGLTGQRGAH